MLAQMQGSFRQPPCRQCHLVQVRYDSQTNMETRDGKQNMDTRERIAKILEHRRARLPAVQAAIGHWEEVNQGIRQLSAAVEELQAHPRTSDEIRSSLQSFDATALHTRVTEAIRQLHLLAGRFSRDTINIGVSGRARVGKSTLLQKLSGLTDQQIPTGSGLPVTAVRSRIVHSSANAHARLTLHSFESFRDEVIAPYHAELGIAQLPQSISDFRSFSYPRSERELASELQERHSSITVLRRLREMQQSLWSYEKDLSGGERTIGLDELRPYVAYPRREEAGSSDCSRPYLAVRDVRIECRFPHTQVEHLGIIDLPGLGEVAANAEEHHLNGLKNDVDAVVMVKRPVEGMAYWTREDANAVNLLDRARGYVSQRRDFVALLINHGSEDAPRVDALRDDILRQVNDGKDGAHFRVLEADATDAKAVADRVLEPLLAHLAERLPAMDEEILVGTRKACLTESQSIRGVLNGLQAPLAAKRLGDISGIEDLQRRSEELRKDLAAALQGLVCDLRDASRSGEEDPEFMTALETAYQETLCWIEDGFGLNRENWCNIALRQMRVDRFSQAFAGHELNRIRVEISGRYCALDRYLTGRVEELWNQVAELLRKHLNQLMGDEGGANELDQLARYFDDAVEPCPTLAQALRELRAMRLDYRTQLHPRVRSALDGLNLQVTDPESGLPEAQISVEVSETGAEQLYRTLSQLAEKATYQTQKALIQEARTPAAVLHASLEQFEDTLIRSGQSQIEFARLGRSFRDDIWPGVYTDTEQATARVNRVRHALNGLLKQIDNVEGVLG